ncbi:MAG: hypothetical protein HN353_00840 [Bdellovibrionales bacterium]|nr:hypothetical protein [Bdellovibrionales bacterium]MBT3524705.1 hypothetical protein [Bdellovibrionales bacterium]
MKLNLIIALLSFTLAVLFTPSSLWASCKEGEKGCLCIYTYYEGGDKENEFLATKYQADLQELAQKQKMDISLGNIPKLNKLSNFCQIDETGFLDKVAEVVSDIFSSETKIELIQKQCRRAVIDSFDVVQKLGDDIEKITAILPGPMASINSIISTNNQCTEAWGQKLDNQNLLLFPGGVKELIQFCSCRDTSLVALPVNRGECQEIRDRQLDGESEFMMNLPQMKKHGARINIYSGLLSVLVGSDELSKLTSGSNACSSINLQENSILPKDGSVPIKSEEAYQIMGGYLKDEFDKLSSAFSKQFRNSNPMVLKQIRGDRRQARLQLNIQNNSNELGELIANRETDKLITALSKRIEKQCRMAAIIIKKARRKGAGNRKHDVDICTRHKYYNDYNNYLTGPDSFDNELRPYSDLFLCESLRYQLQSVLQEPTGIKGECHSMIAANIDEDDNLRGLASEFAYSDKKIPIYNCNSIESDSIHPGDTNDEMFGPPAPPRLEGNPQVTSDDDSFSYSDGSEAKDDPYAFEDIRGNHSRRQKLKDALTSAAKGLNNLPKTNVGKQVTSTTTASSEVISDSVEVDSHRPDGPTTSTPSSDVSQTGSNPQETAQIAKPWQPTPESGYNTPWNNRESINPRYPVTSFAPSISDESLEVTNGSPSGKAKTALSDELQKLRAELAALKTEQIEKRDGEQESIKGAKEKSDPQMVDLEKQVKELQVELKKRKIAARTAVADQPTVLNNRANLNSPTTTGGKRALSSSFGDGREYGNSTAPSQSGASVSSTTMRSGASKANLNAANAAVAAGGSAAFVNRGSPISDPIDYDGRIVMVREVVSQNQAMAIGDFGLKLQENPEALYEQTGGRVVVQDQESGRLVYRVMEFVVEGGVPRLLLGSTQTVDASQILDSQGEVLMGTPIGITKTQEEELLQGLSDVHGRAPATALPDQADQARKYHDDVKGQFDELPSE